MKVHYINILLFALPLNILVRNQRNHRKSILSTTKSELTKTHRTLCECELYAPSNYENDQEMKEVMESFNRQSSERFREYDERMKTTRQKCKDKCDEAIQKIILKDKIEKQLSQQFSKLQTNIETNDIPTCVCEKSLADKTENLCLNCGKTMGAVTPAWGLVNGLGYVGWKISALAAAQKAGVDTGIDVVISTLKKLLTIDGVSAAKWKTLITAENYTNPTLVGEVLKELSNTLCSTTGNDPGGSFCLYKLLSEETLTTAIKTHTQTAIRNATSEVVKVTEAEVGKVTSTSSIYSTAIIASIVAILIIVLIMVIIYLILRYRRKKKMKKKLQYVKLLKE
ncbi:hypothetical protein PFAG_06112 [Plasmodium falciparum Santa Lucia]|uniref:Surface antigen n=1 Tax=Plasmodium falciparum Santa Lucia TaxID=478859 RepID=W7FFN4_PLAFA|nr:hypothetical protein PFAG_06112 [Plasmodium falciparum Santa Lucia]